MTTLRDQAARRRLELNPITTTLGINPQPHQTPNSALSSHSLSAPFGYNPSYTPTPVSAARPYNPQQWTHSPSVASDTGTHHSTGRVQDTEGILNRPLCTYSYSYLMIDLSNKIQEANVCCLSCDACPTSLLSTTKSTGVGHLK